MGSWRLGIYHGSLQTLHLHPRRSGDTVTGMTTLDPLDAAAAAFRAAMYADVIRDNFVLTAYTRALSEAAFTEIATRRASLRRAVRELACEHHGPLTPRARHQLRNAYIEPFESGFLGAHALALWFMHFDEDNWFSYDAVHAPARAYLGAAQTMDERLELRLFKGFDNRVLVPQGVVVRDLPVVLSFASRTLTLWTCGLND